jgi:LemA protein
MSMTALFISLGVIAVVGIVLLLWAVGTYNGLVAGREAIGAAWANIDVLLKRRYDLIPNLVNTVKGYASHEKETLERVIAARNVAASAAAGGPAQAAQLSQAEGQLGGALRQLFAVAEAYPNLKADAGFMQLQGELSNTENQIAGVRTQYNNQVAGWNSKVMTVPTNIIAGIFGFATRAFFEVQDPGQREAPKVSF